MYLSLMPHAFQTSDNCFISGQLINHEYLLIENYLQEKVTRPEKFALGRDNHEAKINAFGFFPE